MKCGFVSSFVATCLVGCAVSALGQDVPRLVSSTPINGAAGVSPTASVVFTFSEPMDTETTSATFVDFSNPFGMLDWTESWNGQMTVLTCVPSEPWPSGKLLFWTLTGDSLFGEPLEEAYGSFTVGSGSGGGGSGTNRFTTFSVGKHYQYAQTSAAAPVLDPEFPLAFFGNVTLASNRTANAISLKLPTGVVTNVARSMFQAEFFSAMAFSKDPTAFEAAYPQGDYEFTVEAATSNQVVKVTMPANLQQPNAPQVSNFSAASAIDPSKPFTLTWAAFQGGTAGDFISVSVGDVFQTGDLGETNALKGTATSVTIPAGTLAPQATNAATLSFWRYVATTNNALSQDTFAYRVSMTQFDLITGEPGGSGTSLVIENAGRAGNQFVFESATTPGQIVTLEKSTSLLPNSWQKVTTTNSPGSRVRFIVPLESQAGATLYRLKDGA
jgi:hypothetical protein